MWTWSIIDKPGRTDSMKVMNSEKHDFKVKKKRKKHSKITKDKTGHYSWDAMVAFLYLDK